MDKEPPHGEPVNKGSGSVKDSLKQKVTKSDYPSTSTSKMDSSDHAGPGLESGLRPSLLDEVLAEKKLALMRSPEVVQFLKTQQDKLAAEKKLTNSCEKNTSKYPDS